MFVHIGLPINSFFELCEISFVSLIENAQSLNHEQSVFFYGQL